MTKEQYKELMGEDPEDMFGPDWQNILDDFDQSTAEKKKEKKEREQDFNNLMDLIK